MNIKMSKFFPGACAVALAAMVAQAHAAITFNATPFVTQTQLNSIYSGNASPIGITFAGNEFVGTGGYSGSNLLYSTNLSGGSISVFGAVPGASGEVVLAASPNGSGYGSNDIFAGSGANGQVYQFANTGGAATLFANVDTLHPSAGQVRGIGFDTTGLYGDNMIVTTARSSRLERPVRFPCWPTLEPTPKGSVLRRSSSEPTPRGRSLPRRKTPDMLMRFPLAGR